MAKIQKGDQWRGPDRSTHWVISRSHERGDVFITTWSMFAPGDTSNPKKGDVGGWSFLGTVEEFLHQFTPLD